MDMPNIADDMNELAYTFDPVSKKDWIQQIEKDLRGKPLDSLLGEWWPGETLQPLSHQEDAEKVVVRLPDNLFKNPPRIVECIDGDNLELDINAIIHSALKFGAETIIIQTTSLKELPLEKWLTGVHLNMATVQLEPSDFYAKDVKALDEWLNKGVEIRVLCNGQSGIAINTLLAEFNQSNIRVNALKFIYDFPAEGVWDQSTTNTINQLLDDLTQWDSCRFDTGGISQTVCIKAKCRPVLFQAYYPN